MFESENEEENLDDFLQTESKSERPHISLEENIRIERQAEKNRQKKIYLRWSILATLLLILLRFLGFNEAYARYVSQNMDFYHVIFEKPADMTAEDFLSEIRKEAGVNGLMLFGMEWGSSNEDALWYGSTVDIYCSEGVRDYLEENRRMKEGTCYGFTTGRVDVTYHDFLELSETDLTNVDFRVMGKGAGVVQFASDVRSFCDCELFGCGDTSYENYKWNCRVILCLVTILICGFWLFYYLRFVRYIKFKITRRVVIGGLIVMVLLYGLWWTIGVRLAYGKYERIVREKGFYSGSYTDFDTGDGFSVSEPIFPSLNMGLVSVEKGYGEDIHLSLEITPRMYGEPEYQLCISYRITQGKYSSWDQYRVKVDTQMEPVGENDVFAVIEYEKNYELLCEFWDTSGDEGWLE
ncbi:MAG: hypothetical protein ACI4DO_01700 [Roseburia sp.]